MDIIKKNVTSFYGSSLWDLCSYSCERIFKSWNVTVRNIFQLDFRTHRYFIEPISMCPHPMTMMSSRLVKFCDLMTNSDKLVVRFLAKLFKGDQRTILGKNLTFIARKCKMDVENLRHTL